MESSTITIKKRKNIVRYKFLVILVASVIVGYLFFEEKSSLNSANKSSALPNVQQSIARNEVVKPTIKTAKEGFYDNDFFNDFKNKKDCVEQDLIKFKEASYKNCNLKIKQAKKELKTFNSEDILHYPSIVDRDFHELTVVEYGDGLESCKNWRNAIDEKIDDNLNYISFDFASLDFFKGIEKCLKFEFNVMVSDTVVSDPESESEKLYSILSDLVERKKWDELIYFIEKENFDVSTIFLASPKIPNSYAPTLISMLIMGNSPQHVFDWVLNHGAKVDRSYYRLAVIYSSVSFLKEMKKRLGDLNLTIDAKSLYEHASVRINSPMYRELNKLGVDPNLSHGNGGDEKDLLYRMLEIGNIYEAVELISIGSYVSNEHLAVAPKELYHYVKKMNCEVED